jgi:glucose/arabinose dehydrogenase
VPFAKDVRALNNLARQLHNDDCTAVRTGRWRIRWEKQRLGERSHMILKGRFYIEAGTIRLTAWLLFVGIIAAGSARAGSLTGPILDEGVAAELRDVLQLPASVGSPPDPWWGLARVGIVRQVPDGSGRLFANDLRGRLYVIQGATVTTYMDLSVLIPALKSTDLQLGFVSYAFHPEFASNGLIYTAHTEYVGTTTPNLGPAIPATIIHHAVVTEWHASNPSANTFSGTHRELMRIASPHTYHNLGVIDFDPNLGPTDPDYGLLYIAAGDFGSIELHQPGQLQRLDTVYGCLLRIDPLGGPFQRNGITFHYGIPSSNPFANDGNPATFGEIFAYGFRNPENFHFDRGGLGSLFVAEIGQGNVEEVNLPRAGLNYGWPEREGTFAVDVDVDPETVLPLPANDSSLGFTYPVAQYDHAEGQAIAGGLVVRRGPPSACGGNSCLATS